MKKKSNILQKLDKKFMNKLEHLFARKTTIKKKT